MIRLLSIFSALLVLGIAVAACGGKSKTQGTPTSASQSPAASGTARGGAAAPQNATALASGSPAPANQTPGAGAPDGAGGTPAGDGAAPGSASGTPSYTFSTPTGSEASPGAGGAPTPGAPPSTAVSGGPAGGAIAVGATTLAAGNVEVAVNLTGTGIPAFVGFNVHLRWNASILKFASANSTGTVLTGSVFCPSALADADGAGAILACTAVPTTEVSSAGLLGTFVLTPVGTGCSPLHLFTVGGADGGDTGDGTFTMDTATKVVLTVTVDGSVDQAGQHC